MIGTKKHLFFLLLLSLVLGSCNKLTRLLAKRQADTTYSTTSTSTSTNSKSSPPKVEVISTWQVETFYVIQDIYPELGERIIMEIQNRVLINPKAIRRLTKSEAAEVSGLYDSFGFAIHPSEISNLDKLARIQKVITDVSEKEVVPLKLTRNVLNFQSVSGDVASATKIFGEASPDSIVEVDDGSGRLVKVYADERGLWDARIVQNDQLRARNGFVYIKISKGEAIQYLEMDVLSKKMRRVNVAELPRDSILLVN